jgi:nucleoside-diphosphate-sugar epimerase
MTVFVTGANGFIGLELMRQCKDRGIDFTGVDLSPVNTPNRHVGDIRDPSIADLIPEKADAIVHLAALSRDPDCKNRAGACFDINVMGTLNLIDAAEKRNVRQFIFASTEWVYDKFEPGRDKTEDGVIDPRKLRSEYAFSKLVSENNLRQKFQHGFCPATVLRFGIVYGSRRGNWSAVESLFNTVATGDEVTVGSLATARRFIHVSDIADAVLSALGTPGFEIVNIQGARPVTLGEVIETSAEISGGSPRVTETDPNAPSIRGVSGAKAETLLGWRAKVDLRDGLTQLGRYLDGTAP